ncbi:transcription factor S [Candidatus Thorarchaeota archaeon]|jgi:DNA-directed RNA polymerase subunit M|nr:MAG: transcription factor S [Candidatus Thorarchaeota archaeon]
MQFCEKCGAMMAPVTDEDGNRVLKCRSCGHTESLSGELRVTHKIEKTPKDKIVVVEDDSIPMPVTKATCPECGNNEAYYWTSQTRRADEGATEFYRCTKCKATWREYGG